MRHTTRDGNVFRAPAAGRSENLTLNAIPEGSRFDADILRDIAQDVVRWYNRRGLFGVWVAYTDFETSVSGLVDNRPAFDLEITPQYLRESKQTKEVVARLAALIEMPGSEILEALEKARTQPAYIPIKIKTDLTRYAGAKLET